MTPSEELREAATTLRTAAEKATHGPWESLADGDRLVALTESGRAWSYVVEEPIGHAGTAAWMALVNPDLAEPLAALLDHLADDMFDDLAEERDFPNNAVNWRRMVVDTWGSSRHDWTYALRLARVINRSST